MGLTCVITVKGDGKGRYGHSKKDRTGPVDSFIVDNTVLYLAVLKHLRKCKICDPREVLQTYLDRRKNDRRMRGFTSEGFINHAEKFRNVCKQRNLPIPEDLIFEARWRIGSPQGLASHAKKLGPEGVVRGLILIKEQDRKDRHLTHNSVAALCQTTQGTTEYIRQLAVIVDNMFTVDRPFPSNQELEELISVADVMLS